MVSRASGLALVLTVVGFGGGCGGLVVLEESSGGQGGDGGAGAASGGAKNGGSGTTTSTGASDAATTTSSVGPSTTGAGCDQVFPEWAGCGSTVGSGGTGLQFCGALFCDPNGGPNLLERECTTETGTCTCKTQEGSCTCSWSGDCDEPCCGDPAPIN